MLGTLVILKLSGNFVQKSSLKSQVLHVVGIST
jgi:hypothetical protein